MVGLQLFAVFTAPSRGERSFVAIGQRNSPCHLRDVLHQGETAPFALFNDREAWDEHFEHDWELIASCTAFKTYLEETNSQIQELMSGIAPELRTLSSSVNSDARTEASDLESMGEIASLISNDDLYDIASSPPQSAMSRRSRRRGFGSMVLEDDDTSCGENSVFSEGLSASVPTSTVHAKSGKHLLSSMAAAVRANYESLSRIYDFFAVLYGQVRCTSEIEEEIACVIVSVSVLGWSIVLLVDSAENFLDSVLPGIWLGRPTFLRSAGTEPLLVVIDGDILTLCDMHMF